MKVAVLSESEGDEIGIRILIDGLLKAQSDPIAGPPLKTRGWPSVLNLLVSVYKHLHYQTDAEAFVFVVDSNDSPVHQSEHELPGNTAKDCRLCQLRQEVIRVQSQVRRVQGRFRIKTAIGVAVPAIEA